MLLPSPDLLPAPALAFLFNLGGPEVVVILLVGVLIFGGQLPDVGRKLGRTVAQLRQGMADFQQQIDADDDFGEARRSFKELGREIKGTRDEARAAAREIPGAVARTRDGLRKSLEEQPEGVAGSDGSGGGEIENAQQAGRVPDSVVPDGDAPDGVFPDSDAPDSEAPDSGGPEGGSPDSGGSDSLDDERGDPEGPAPDQTTKGS